MSGGNEFIWWVGGVVVLVTILQQLPKVGAILLLLVTFGALLRAEQTGKLN